MLKRAMALALALICALGAPIAARGEAPLAEVQLNADDVANSAFPLFEILLMCPNLTSFDGEPPFALATSIIDMYLAARATPADALSREDAYAQLFVHGAYLTLANDDAYADADFIGAPIAARAVIESAIESGVGTVIASIQADYDYGFGWEFGCRLDITLLPDPSAPYGARISKIFFPE